MKNAQKGFSPALVLVLIAIVIAGAGIYMLNINNNSKNSGAVAVLSVAGTTTKTATSTKVATSSPIVNNLVPSVSNTSVSSIIVSTPRGSATATSTTQATATFTLSISNPTIATIFVSKNPTTLIEAAVIGKGTGSISSIQVSPISGDTANSYAIAPGTTRTFSLSATFRGTPGSPFQFKIVALRYGTSDLQSTGQVISTGLNSLVANIAF